MPLIKSDIDNILNNITQKLSSEVQDTLRKVVLYGSYARGDFTEDSDIDIMVLVDSPDPYNLCPSIHSYENALYDKYEVMVSCRFQNYKHFYSAINTTSFYKNVEREGIVYYDSTA